MGEVDWGLQIWTLLTFGGLLFLLGKFAFKPLRNALAEREKVIRGALDQAAQAKREAEQLTEENRKKLELAWEEARTVINTERRAAEAIRKEAVEQAHHDADAFMAAARAEIDRELQKSLLELKSTVTNLSMNIARQVIREGLNETRHKELTEEYVQKLKESHANRPS